MGLADTGTCTRVSADGTNKPDCRVTAPVTAPNGVIAPMTLACELCYSHAALDERFTILVLK